MKRIYISLAMSMLTIAGAFAAPLSPEEALQRVEQSDNPLHMIGTRGQIPATLKLTKKSADGKPALYVFDRGETGYMIVSADDSTLPLLGYSVTGTIDPDNMPPALEGWLNGYKEQVEYARANATSSAGAESRSVTLPAWAPIAPMLKTTWDQNAPFNNKCPRYNNKACPTGCVATAMSQVMNYFQWPEQGKGFVSYQCNFGTSQMPIYQTLTMNMNQQKFDWGNMIDSYLGNYTDAQADAVATLMAAAGYSVQMNYGTSQSGAISGYIPGALVNYFDYDPSAMFISRSQKNYTEWATLIYNNLKNVGPVIYDGDTAFMGGHSFVCDGYQGNGYFHFNWGWSGMSDGYFLLDALNPAALGTGGAEGGFNFRQDVVINIQKPKAGSKPTPNQLALSGSLYGTASSAYLYLSIQGSDYTGFRYYGNENIVFDLGAQIVEADNPNASPQYFEVVNTIFKGYPLDPGVVCFCNGSGNYPFPMLQLSKLGLKENVKYKVSVAYKEEGGDWALPSVSQGCYNYFYVTKTSSGTYEFENFDVMEFDCTQLEPIAPIYDNIAAQLKLSLVNNNDVELTRGVILMLLNESGNVAFYGDSFALTLAPKETYSLDWTTTLVKYSSTAKVPGQYYLALYDMDTATYYYKSASPVDMNAYPGEPTFTCSYSIDNSQPLNGVYQVENSQDIKVSTTVNVTKGIFSKNLYLVVMYQQGNNLYSTMSIPLDVEVVNAGDSYTYSTNINFNTATVGTTYYLGVATMVNNQLSLVNPTPLQFKVLGNFTGIDSILSDSEDIIFVQNKASKTLEIYGGQSGIASVETYYINGMKASATATVLGDKTTLDLSSLGKGIVVVTAVDKAGNRKSVKLAL